MDTVGKEALWQGWKTVRKIGSGSFGTVYEIEREFFGEVEKGALKVIIIPQNDSDVEELRSLGYDNESIAQHYKSYLENIVREYTLMAKLKGHSNIVDCDDLRYVPHENGFGWDILIKMELLTPMLKALDRFDSEQQIVQLGIDLCQALVTCRKRSIIHRDIKPQNIFLSADGNFKLGDFGIAKTAEKTTGGTKTGTYNYMAPEVYNNQPYGVAADIYSLGLVLYWLLNERRMPFMPLPPQMPTPHLDEQARYRRFCGEPLPPPAHGSEELKRVVLKACAFSPSERYTAPEELLAALRGLQPRRQTVSPMPAVSAQAATDGTISFAQQAVTATPPTEETLAAVSAQPEEQTIGILLQRGSHRPVPPPATPTVAAGSIAAPAAAPQPHMPPQAPVKQKKKRKWIVPLLLALLLLATVFAIWYFMSAEDARDGQDEQESITTQKPATEPTSPSESTPASENTSAAPAHIYEYWLSDCDWEQAQQTAIEKGGYLACFETEEEYLAVLQDIADSGLEKIYFRIGARRAPEREEYYWVDKNNQPFGECLNKADAWTNALWEVSEPSFRWEETEEMYLQMYYSAELGRWVWNDTALMATFPKEENTKGYIIEYDSDADIIDVEPVADVTGKTKEEAVALLEALDFTVTVEESFDSKVPAGAVISQQPLAGTPQAVGQSVVIYVSKGKQTVSVQLDAQGGSVSQSTLTLDCGGPYGSLPTPSKNGQTFTGWFTAPEGGDRITEGAIVTESAAHTLYAQWSTKVCTLTLNANGGSVSPSSLSVAHGSAYGTLPTPTREHYRFEGWYTAATGGSRVSSSTSITGDATIYARWSLNNYTLTLNANGGTVSQSSLTLAYGSAYGTLPTPTRAYFKFLGWYTEHTGGSKVSSGTTISANTTVYAHWEQNPVSNWVLASTVPADAQILQEQWTYDKTTYAQSWESTMTGYTLYKTTSEWSDYGGWSGWSTTPVSASDSRQVETKTVTDVAGYTQYRYWRYRKSGASKVHWCDYLGKYYHGGIWYQEYTDWSNSAKSLYKSAYGTCSCHGTANAYGPSNNLYYWEETRWIAPVTHTEYRYRDRTLVYTYYFKKTESLVSNIPIAASDDVTNVQHWVKYRAK